MALTNSLVQRQGRARIRVAWLALILTATCAALVVIPSSRHALLSRVGRLLVVDEPVQPSDAIVVTIDAGTAGVLEAADLVQQAIARRVAVFVETRSHADDELLHRGVHDDPSTRGIHDLHKLGVSGVEPIPEPVTGTEGEGEVLPLWCDRTGVRSVVVVASREHTRRIRRVFRRSFNEHSVRVSIHPARLSQFDPDRWWQTRAGTRLALVELQKLGLDVLRHPWPW